MSAKTNTENSKSISLLKKERIQSAFDIKSLSCHDDNILTILAFLFRRWQLERKFPTPWFWWLAGKRFECFDSTFDSGSKTTLKKFLTVVKKTPFSSILVGKSWQNRNVQFTSLLCISANVGSQKWNKASFSNFSLSAARLPLPSFAMPLEKKRLLGQRRTTAKITIENMIQ